MKTHELINRIVASAEAYPHDTFTCMQKVYTCINPYSYHIQKENEDVYGQMDGIFVDGIAMCWMIRLLWGKKIPRLSFDMTAIAADLFNELSDENNNKSIYFIGAKEDEISKTIEQFRSNFPSMNIIGYRNGYFKSAEEQIDAINAIIEANPDFTVIGMGSPLQEKFALCLKNKGYQGIAFTCGGFLHQTCNKLNYYPEWVNKYNLRSIYRIFHEKGMLKRLNKILFEFPTIFTIDTIKEKIITKQVKYSNAEQR